LCARGRRLGGAAAKNPSESKKEQEIGRWDSEESRYNTIVKEEKEGKGAGFAFSANIWIKRKKNKDEEGTQRGPEDVTTLNV